MSIMTIGGGLARMAPALRSGLQPLAGLSRSALGPQALRPGLSPVRGLSSYTLDYWPERFTPGTRIVGAGPLGESGAPSFVMTAENQLRLSGHVAISQDGRQVASAMPKGAQVPSGEPPLRSYGSVDELMAEYRAGRLSGGDLAANMSRAIDASGAFRGPNVSAFSGDLKFAGQLPGPTRQLALSGEHYDLARLPDVLQSLSGEFDRYAIPITERGQTHCVDLATRALNAVRKPGVPRLPSMANSHPNRLVSEVEQIQSAPPGSPPSRALVPLENAPARSLVPVGGDAGAAGGEAAAAGGEAAAAGEAVEGGVSLGEVVEAAATLLLL